MFPLRLSFENSKPASRACFDMGNECTVLTTSTVLQYCHELLLLFTFFFLLALYDLSNLSVLHFWVVLGYVCIWMIQVKMWWKHCYMLYFYCFINGLSNVPSQHWWALLGFVLVCMFWQGNIKPYFSHSKASFGRRVTPSPSAWACFTARYSSRHWPTHAFGGF